MTPETIPVDKALWERCAKLVRDVAAAGIYQLPVVETVREAMAIVPQLPISVDPLVLRAREILAAENVGMSYHQEEIMRGVCDDSPSMRAVLAALREKESG
jgi:hypothetical protein